MITLEMVQCIQSDDVKGDMCEFMGKGKRKLERETIMS